MHQYFILYRMLRNETQNSLRSAIVGFPKIFFALNTILLLEFASHVRILRKWKGQKMTFLAILTFFLHQKEKWFLYKLNGVRKYNSRAFKWILVHHHIIFFHQIISVWILNFSYSLHSTERQIYILFFSFFALNFWNMYIY